MGLKKWFSKDKRIYKLFDKEGFYIILFLCICIVAITATWVSKKNMDNIVTEDIKTPSLEENKDRLEDFPTGEVYTKEPVIVVEDIKENDQSKNISTAFVEKHTDTTTKKPKPKIKKQKEKVETQKNLVKQQNKSITKEMNMPVTGKIGMNYAKDTLVYSKTLEEYKTHNGIDIIAPENTPVNAALAGEVVEVSRDAKLGITVSIAHSGNMISKYANLSTDSMVKVGDLVEQGQVISGVGKTALFEVLEEPHLHFEVLVDGENIDPNQFLHIQN